MLSVQSPGYAGMERFGVDAGLGSPPNHRRKMRTDSMQTHDLLLSGDHSMITNKSDSHSSLLAENHHIHYCHHDHQDGIMRCPHHVALPDSDWSPSPNNSALHIRNSYQQAEITRSYIRPPPNKTASDVPFNYMPDVSNTHPNHQRNVAMNATANNNKSKHNPLAKFLLRISSPKSHENNSTLTNTTYRNNLSMSSALSTASSSSSSSSSSTSSSNSSALLPAHAMTGTTSRQSSNGPSTKVVRSMAQSQSQSQLPPSYSESQLQYQLDQRAKFQSVSSPPSSQICVSSLSLRTSPSNTPSNNFSQPKINKSRSLCNEINYNSMSISTTPTAMINSIVNNTAIIGSTSSSSSTISIADETSSNASINDLPSINQIEYSINALTDSDVQL